MALTFPEPVSTWSKLRGSEIIPELMMLFVGCLSGVRIAATSTSPALAVARLDLGSYDSRCYFLAVRCESCEGRES